MRILFVHQNYPGQFVYLAEALRARGHEVLALVPDTNKRRIDGPVARYQFAARTFERRTLGLATQFAEQTYHAEATARAADILHREHGYVPDLIIGHPGWGETLFLHQVWPGSRQILYCEFFYRPAGLDVGFDPEFPAATLDMAMWVTARQAPQLLAFANGAQGLSPSKFQASTYPDHLRSLIRVIHDGVDTTQIRPRPDATFTATSSGRTFRSGDEVISFVSRNLEPYRGYHVFMRALPRFLAERPNAHVVIVGGDSHSYSTRPPDGRTWKQIYLDEVADRIDPARVHFVGRVPFADFLALMQVTKAHVYLTYPFVASWSLLQAMAAGAPIVASNTPPVREFIEHGVNGSLFDFFDTDALVDRLVEAINRPFSAERMAIVARRTITQSYDLRSVCLPQQLQFIEGS